jgi:hypothetical protein
MSETVVIAEHNLFVILIGDMQDLNSHSGVYEEFCLPGYNAV